MNETKGISVGQVGLAFKNCSGLSIGWSSQKSQQTGICEVFELSLFPLSFRVWCLKHCFITHSYFWCKPRFYWQKFPNHMQWTKTVLNTQYNKCFNNLHSGGSKAKEWIHNFKFLLWDNQMRTEWFHWKDSLWAGFGPARWNPIGFPVQSLNLSAITASIHVNQWEIWKKVPDDKRWKYRSS